jgi:protein SCO1/2
MSDDADAPSHAPADRRRRCQARVFSRAVRAFVLAPFARALLVVTVIAAGCATPQRLIGTDLGAGAAPDFTLTDGLSGRAVTLSGLRGRVVALTFLYTRCPDVCPLTALRFREAQSSLGGERGEVVFMAVSVDPAGDTPANVRAFSDAVELKENWHYLVGRPEQLAPVWASYGIRAVPDEGRPTVTHTDAVYLIDRQGRERVLMRPVPETDDLVANLRILIAAR